MSELKRIMVLEALAHDYIVEVEPPNLMRLDVHPAVSFGLGSRPVARARAPILRILKNGMLTVIHSQRRCGSDKNWVG